MKKNPVSKPILGVICIGCMLALVSMVTPPQLSPWGGPVIKKLPTYRGDHYPSFAEFRVQEIEFDGLGVLMLTGKEPYNKLINVTYITEVHRYEDINKKDYSTLVYMQGKKDPMLFRQTYKEVTSSIRKSMEGMVK